ncbi:MAG: murein transglycosylase A [Alphaproteobacteria bacterium]|nr:murein transglycosylase A [Alphaproteobacteria bacterium]
MTYSSRFLNLAGTVLLLAGCAGQPFGPGAARLSGPEQLSLAPASYTQLAGWSDDRAAAAVPAFLKSCARLTGLPDAAALDAKAGGTSFGTVGEWRSLCRSAAALPPGDDTAARRFFESNLTPYRAGDRGDPDGLFTAYYEAEVKGSRERRGPYQTPVYRRPAELASLRPYLDRGAIEDGALAERSLEVMWLADPADLLTLQTQGSGRVRLEDGSVVRLGYDGNNGRRPVALDQLLVSRGEIPAAQLSQQAVRAWMLSYPAQARTIRRANQAYVFFRELKGDGPVGAEGAVLTPGRSLAVDRRFVPLGMPLWLEASDRYSSARVNRLMVAQDTGDGIEGPVRGDIYWGSGAEAAAHGGDFYADGRYFLLLPRRPGFASAR